MVTNKPILSFLKPAIEAGLSNRTLLLYMRMVLRYGQGEEWHHITNEDLRKLTGLHTDAVSRALRHLRAKGFIDMQHIPQQGGTYRLIKIP